MHKKLIVFATQAEARASLELLRAKPQEGSSATYVFDEGLILICGMGTLAAAVSLSQCISHVDEVWNFGLAGALHDSLEIEKVHSIRTVSAHFTLPHDLDAHSKQFGLALYPSLQCSEPHGLRLASAAFPIHQQASRGQLAEHYDLVDMEGYGIVYAAQHHQKPCFLRKLVSDLASEKTQGLIKQKLDHYSTLLAKAIAGGEEGRNRRKGNRNRR